MTGRLNENSASISLAEPPRTWSSPAPIFSSARTSSELSSSTERDSVRVGPGGPQSWTQPAIVKRPIKTAAEGTPERIVSIGSSPYPGYTISSVLPVPGIWMEKQVTKALLLVCSTGGSNPALILALVHSLAGTHLLHWGILIGRTMVCSYCRKNIGLLRRLKDQQFCCDDHRQKLASRSARALREAEDLYGFEDTRLPTWRSITQTKPEDKT